MDLTSMMKTMLSSDSIAQMSKKTGTSTDGVKSVLLSSLPAMLNGVKGQANNKSTVAGFAGALDSHAQDDTSDISSFLANVDLEDGDKIVKHLLGSSKSATTRAAAKKAGISTSSSKSIIDTAAPLLMSLIGQQATQTAQAKPQSYTVNVGTQQTASSGMGLLSSLLGDSAQTQASSHQSSGLGSLLGSLFGGSQQTAAQSTDDNAISGMIGSMLGNVDVTSLLSGMLGNGK